MTEAEAKAWLAARFPSSGLAALERLEACILRANQEQNLIAPSTVKTIWARHIVDSAQLIALAEGHPGLWIDIGSGAGFPGLIVAALGEREVWLVEPRKRRAEFLRDAIATIGLSKHARVLETRIETVDTQAALLSARAVAPLAELFAWSHGCTTIDTLWLLPKGRSAREEVASARQAWHGVFHVERSVTDPESLIVLASGVSRR